MMKFLKLTPLLAVILWLAPANTHAANELAKAEIWLNALTTIQADFTQESSDGTKSSGKFYLRRPYNSRFDYDDSAPLILITTESWVHVDEQDQQLVTSYPVSETPLEKILRDPIRLTSGDFTASGETVGRFIRINLKSVDGAAAGELILDFIAEPMELVAWHVIDANDITTSIRLDNIVRGQPLSPRLFVPNVYETDR